MSAFPPKADIDLQHHSHRVSPLKTPNIQASEIA